MRILVWQWGRRGAGPRVAAGLASGFASLPGVATSLSLARDAELLSSAEPPRCDLPMPTYRSVPGFVARAALTPLALPGLVRRIRALTPDCAVCAMPGPLDLLMAAALRRARVPFAVVVHDAALHPGDGFPGQMWLQRRLMRRAGALVTLSQHVRSALLAAGWDPSRLLESALPPFVFLRAAPPVGGHGGELRLLCFGRLLPYKGLDLLAECLARLPAGHGFVLRVVGRGPESEALAALRRLPGVTVENRWVPEDEVGALLAWADAVVLTHREASQSGVAAAALAAGRWVVGTRVGGLAEQLRGQDRALLCEPEPGSVAEALARLRRALQDGAHGAPAAAEPEWDAAALARQLGRVLLPAARAARPDVDGA